MNDIVDPETYAQPSDPAARQQLARIGALYQSGMDADGRVLSRRDRRAKRDASGKPRTPHRGALPNGWHAGMAVPGTTAAAREQAQLQLAAEDELRADWPDQAAAAIAQANHLALTTELTHLAAFGQVKRDLVLGMTDHWKEADDVEAEA